MLHLSYPPYTPDRGKKISALINDWENDNVYENNLSKARPWLLASAICFIL